MHSGGGGGKGTWGKPGDELGVDSVTTDINDPNYDSDGQVFKLQTQHDVDVISINDYNSVIYDVG